MPTKATRLKLAPDPHDTYVKKVFGELPQARAFFRAYLPENVPALFDWRTLRLECVNFILLSVTDEPRQAEVRGALQSVQDEFLPVKEHLMTTAWKRTAPVTLPSSAPQSILSRAITRSTLVRPS